MARLLASLLAFTVLLGSAACGRGKLGLVIEQDGTVNTAAITRMHLKVMEIETLGPKQWRPVAFEAIIEDIEFLGAFCRARLVARDEPALVLLADFSANLMRDVGVEVGKALLVALPPDSLRIFARSSRIAEEETAS